MRKILIFISLLSIFLFLTMPVFALDLGSGETKKAGKKAGYAESTSEITFAQNIGTVIKASLAMVGVIFLVLMVYAGYLWMTARGEEQSIEKAKKIITAAIIGLIIVVGAYSITSFVVPRILAGAAAEQPKTK